MKKGQMSMEIAILIIGALVCACIGGYHFTTNVADSGSNAGNSASSVCIGLNPENSGTITNFENIIEINNNQPSSESTPYIPYWIENTSYAWIKLNLTEGINSINISKNGEFESNPNSVFIIYDNFTELNSEYYYNESIISSEITPYGLRTHSEPNTWVNYNCAIFRDIYLPENFEILCTINHTSQSSDINKEYIIVGTEDNKFIYGGYCDAWAGSSGSFSCGHNDGTTTYGSHTGEGSRGDGLTTVNLKYVGSTYEIYENGNLYYTNTYVAPFTRIGLMDQRYNTYNSEIVYWNSLIVKKAMENEPIITTQYVDDVLQVNIDSSETIDNYSIKIPISALEPSNMNESFMITYA